MNKPSPGTRPAEALAGLAQRTSLSPLKDRQVVVWHLQNNACHRSAVMWAMRKRAAVVPRAVGLPVGVVDQLIPDGRIPFRPVAATGDPHGLDRVVVPVVVVHQGLLSLPLVALRCHAGFAALQQVIQALVD